MPVTAPVAGSTEAIAVLLLLHAPPATAFDNVVVAPVQMVVPPVIEAGDGLTVTEAVAGVPQPVE
jgi:hypothetical protein